MQDMEGSPQYNSSHQEKINDYKPAMRLPCHIPDHNKRSLTLLLKPIRLHPMKRKHDFYEINFHLAIKKSPLGAFEWCRLRDLNSRPTDYKSVALPTELNRPNENLFILKKIFRQQLF